MIVPDITNPHFAAIVRAAEHAGQHRRAAEQHEHADALPESVPVVGVHGQRIEGVQVDGRHDQQRRPAEHL